MLMKPIKILPTSDKKNHHHHHHHHHMERKMGSPKEKTHKFWRAAKTLFFLTTMIASLLFFSAPLLIVIIDALLPSALLSTLISPFSPQSIAAHLKNYDFRASIIDLPLLSLTRSIIIICVYCICDKPGLSRGPYLVITTLCSLFSMVFVAVKAFTFSSIVMGIEQGRFAVREAWAMEALFMSSLALAVAHFVVAYRTICRERRKMLVFRIDLEAVAASKKGFPLYHKIVPPVRIL
ncbi:hypothetical protein QJS04_geneDACA000905 [Acorus gramineus]|uniref:MENTAL domain-containing protein n=1 Tax=Acorus gramineus TaxID=55184 RepID=A0AAV9AEV4_ACOGR|nr:hypothetical protein QJS04_geneDACA000905 [Acorus gramineus]